MDVRSFREIGTMRSLGLDFGFIMCLGIRVEGIYYLLSFIEKERDTKIYRILRAGSYEF